ncbi:MAG TPA: radical SAM protein [Acidobacteriota bacterium]|nr:radical SAM protein [Acidobacteriota bacterium]
MKLQIIQPAHYVSYTNRSLHRTTKRSVVNLVLPYLAALTPEGWDVVLIDEQLEDVDFDAAVDVVAITAWTMNSLRAYEIADRFRQRGVKVIMGGPHTFFHRDEAAAHCDAVGIGEGEHIWARMLEDAVSGRLERFYQAERVHDLGNLPLPRYNLLNLKKYGFLKTYSVQSSRGCPFNCSFCSERMYLGDAYRFRPVGDVVAEIRYSGSKNILFADSNFAGNVPHAMELMEALIPLRVRWSALWSAHLCKNEAFMDLAKKSGLLHLNIGMESIDSKTLAAMNKKANKAADYGLILRGLRKRGISYSLNFIFGWDTETEDVFEATYRFLMEHKVPAAYFNILTPDKGTVLYDRMKEERRLLNIDDMGRYPGDKCFIVPVNFSGQTLEGEVKELYRKFYRFPSMVARLPLPVTKENIASWVINFSQKKMAKADGTENFDDF